MNTEKEYIQRVRKNVKRLRLKKGLTMVELADGAELEKQHIYRLETGSENTIPNLKTLIKIAKGLEVDLQELFKP
jgi:transcriptional regulator with XRE-family HTH domain